MNPQINCQYMNGYKPCGRSLTCDEQCHSFVETKRSVLIIHLGALGAVVRSTALLEGISKKYPQHRIIWVTDKPAHHLLQGHPLIQKVFTTEYSDILALKSFDFTATFVIDKSLKATGILQEVRTNKVFGFNALNGVIVPATVAAQELWELGLSDKKKFFENTKSEVQLMYEALELDPYQKQEYNLPLTDQEKLESQTRRELWSEDGQKVVGINTGCSHVISYKKLTVNFHRELIRHVLDKYGERVSIVLLGGPEDSERNTQIAQGLDVTLSSTSSGLRDGLVSVAACDVVLTGDSLGMHMAISQKKHVIAWFGPTCAHEIELYGRGEALLTEAPCAPCWKRSCQKEVMCYDQVSINKWMQALHRGLDEQSEHSYSDSLLR